MSSEELQPIWARPEPGARRARLTREEIAVEALRIADEEGIEAVSMRRVASELGVGTMSLYYYVKTKAELLDLMSDVMLGEVLVPPGEMPTDWRDALEAIAGRSLAAFRRHRWAMNEPPTAPGPNAMRHFEQSLEAVSSLDVDTVTKVEIISMVDDYVLGFVMREVLDADESHGLTEVFGDALTAYFESQLQTGEYPQIEALTAGEDARTVFNRVMSYSRDESRFNRGIRRLLDGIALDLERRGLV